MPQAPDMPRMLSPARVIARFAVRLVLLMGFAAFGSVGFGRSLAVLLWMSIVLCALASLVRRSRCSELRSIIGTRLSRSAHCSRWSTSSSIRPEPHGSGFMIFL